MQPAEQPFRPTRILTHANSGMLAAPLPTFSHGHKLFFIQHMLLQSFGSV